MNQPQCKTVADLHRAWANVLDMCKGTKVKPEDCWQKGFEKLNREPFLNGDPEDYHFTIAIVEDKPVFPGDELYHNFYGKIIAGGECIIAKDNSACFSWNPPKPATIMVELLVEDAEETRQWGNFNTSAKRIREACRKALEAK